MKAPRTVGDRLALGSLVAVCVAVVVFLMAPALVLVPLSFNAESGFVFTEGMLRLDPAAFSLRWYQEVFDEDDWMHAFGNSILIGVAATAMATVLGTLAALGLANPAMPARTALTTLAISPLVTPIIISATGMSFFFAEIGLLRTHLGIILAHTALCTPLVVVTITATLTGFDYNLNRAAESLGAGPLATFFLVQLPQISRGIVSGALFAFVASLDEVIVVTFIGGLEHRTIPRRMWSGIREHLSPEILAVATMLVVFALLVVATVEWLRYRAERS